MKKRKTKAERNKQYGGNGFKLNQTEDFKKLLKKYGHSKEMPK